MKNLKEVVPAVTAEAEEKAAAAVEPVKEVAEEVYPSFVHIADETARVCSRCGKKLVDDGHKVHWVAGSFVSEIEAFKVKVFSVHPVDAVKEKGEVACQPMPEALPAAGVEK